MNIKRKLKSLGIAVVFLSILTSSLVELPISNEYLLQSEVQAATTLNVTFKDTSNNWANSYIKAARDEGLISGYTDGTFRPENNMTREESAHIISKYVGGVGNKNVVVPRDSRDRWSTEAIRNLLDKDIVKGYGDSTFKPLNNITRAEFASLVYKAVSREGKLNSSKKTFKDTSNHWAREAIESLAGNGIINGYTDSTFKPQNYITRSEAATMVASIMYEKAYTKKEIDYFKEIAIGAEYGGTPTIKKWLHDVNVRVAGNPTTEDLRVFNKVVGELNSLISTVDVEVVDKDADITLYFVPRKDFKKYVSYYVEGNDGFFEYTYKQNDELDKATIVIASKEIDQEFRSHLIREELTQVFGLAKDSYMYKDSIFYQGFTLVQKYSELDKTIIKMLYLPEVRVGFSERQVEQVLKNKLVKKVQAKTSLKKAS